VALVSCKKDISVTNEQPLNSFSDDYYTETAPPVQTQVSHNIDANIGGYPEALWVSYAQHTNKKYSLMIFLHGRPLQIKRLRLRDPFFVLGLS
jgi:hypothetical protein